MRHRVASVEVAGGCGRGLSTVVMVCGLRVRVLRDQAKALRPGDPFDGTAGPGECPRCAKASGR
jgi:hypothetical protein